jgi:hypothetical protein
VVQQQAPQKVRTAGVLSSPQLRQSVAVVVVVTLLRVMAVVDAMVVQAAEQSIIQVATRLDLEQLDKVSTEQQKKMPLMVKAVAVVELVQLAQRQPQDMETLVETV